MSEQQHPIAEAAYAFFSHARLAWALSLITLTTVFTSNLLPALLGTVGYSSLILAEMILLLLTLIARRRSVRWNVFVPLSLLAFLAWSIASYFWSYYDRFTLEGVLTQLALSFLAVGVAAIRDTIQLIRAFGDVFRVVLSLSLILEIFAGILIDTPLEFLDVPGNITSGTGIQGIFGDRSAFMVVSLLAVITFVLEWRTRSVSLPLSLSSLAGGVLCFVLGASPVGYATAAGVALIAGILLLLRKLAPASRKGVEVALASLLAAALVTAYLFRTALLTWLSTSPALSLRLSLWAEELRLARMKLIEGWGWVGTWPDKTPPFTVMNSGTGEFHDSGLNVYLDTWLQLGLVGVALLLMLIGIALFRSWQLATTKRSELYLWAPLILTTLIISGFAESIALTSWGWFLIVIVVARSSAELSWRKQPIT